jgi:hypothetical protein
MPNELPQDGPVWMVVATTNGIMEASIIHGRLASFGIPAIIHRESLGAVLGLTIGALGEATVAVPERYYEAAMLVLYPDDGPRLADPDEGDFEAWEEDDDDDPRP